MIGLYKNKLTILFISLMTSIAAVAMEKNSNDMPVEKSADKILVEKLTSIPKEQNQNQKNNDPESDIKKIDSNIKKFDAAFGSQTFSQEFTNDELIIKNLIQDFITQEEKTVSLLITDEINIIINELAYKTIQQSNADNIVEKINDFVEKVIKETSMSKSGIMSIAAQIACAKALKGAVSLLVQEKNAVKILNKVINKAISKSIKKTIKKHCSDKNKVEYLTKFVKKSLIKNDPISFISSTIYKKIYTTYTQPAKL